ncbi:valine--tRNA ligase, partial [candidate division KSB1 bacterium]|nr:valine--tRNA ligase [candidate division KSB1 bacterium]
YRGEYIINWCPRCTTALSDEEAIHEEHGGNLWYIKYPIRDSEKFVTVATTRPETMLGDTAVAVNPNDPRFKKLIGKTVLLPVLQREIPVIADEMVDPKFGTGAVKVTPAHDPNDFEIGNRHNLPRINVMNGDARMNENAGPYNGYDRYKCREALIKQLSAQGLLTKTEKHTHSVAHCQRCDTTVEPYLSRQWFVKIKPLSEPALKAVQDGKIKFHPEKWIKVYSNWMKNIRDWCISRQLWWGHRIPVYYCQDCENMMVRREAPEQCDKCQSTSIRQDEDVLDTWFSSWLWPFSTMDWPQDAPELKYFYPTSTLVTAPDIIFFWVARMIMAGLEFMDGVPFNTVYFNGLIRDIQGRKMSKSLGNGIDPLEMVDKYSADAVRFSLLMLTSEGQDINLAESSFEIGRNFANKLWNSFRFIGLNLEDDTIENAASNKFMDRTDRFELSDRWILSRYNKLIKNITENLEKFKLNDAVSNLYSFFWREYCDWYLELIKPRLYGDDIEAKKTALEICLFIQRGLVKLMHPFIPFITEEIWHHIKTDEEPDLIVSEWVTHDESLFSNGAEEEMLMLQQLIGSVRNIRGEMNVPPNKKARLLIKSEDSYELIMQNDIYLKSLSQVEEIEMSADIEKPKYAASAVVNNMEIFIPLEGLIDIDVERNRLEKEVSRLEKQIENTEKKLMNKDFLNKAPQDVIERERRKSQAWQDNLEKLKANLESLTNSD